MQPLTHSEPDLNGLDSKPRDRSCRDEAAAELPHALHTTSKPAPPTSRTYISVDARRSSCGWDAFWADMPG